MNKTLTVKNILLKSRLSFLLLFIVSSAFAQEGTVIVINTDTKPAEQTIFVKWFINDVSCDEGVNIYRKKITETKWKKITASPYKYIRPISIQAHDKDPSLKDFVKLFNETLKKDLKSIILLNVLLKAIQSDDYAKYLGILFEDKTVTKGETYTYKVMKLNKGFEQLIGISSEITSGIYEHDIAPQNFKITAGIHRASMIWKPELKRYYAVNIYRHSSIKPNEIQLNDLPIMLSQKTEKDGTKSIPEPYFSDDSLQNDVTYYYRIEGEDFFGRKTLSSDTISVLIKDLVPPPPPFNLHPEQDNLKTTLIWDIDESEDLFGFNLYKSTDDSIYSKINESLLAKTDTSYIDIAKRSGIFFYYVTAVDKDNNEARSPKLMLEIPDIIPPVKPKNLTAKPDTGRIHLSWTPNTDDDLMGYIVYRRIAEKKNTEFAPLTADPVTTNKFTDKLSKIARNYFQYAVAAIDSAYNVSDLSNIASAQMPDILPPHKPKFKKTWINEEGVIVEWIPNMEPDLLGYNIFKKEKTDTTAYKQLNKALLNPGSNQYTDKKNKAGAVYYYRLNAIDSAGNSSPLSIPFFAAIIKPEQTDSSSLKKVTLSYNKRTKTVRLKWKVSKETTYKGCVIYKQEANKSLKPVTGLMKKQYYNDKDIKENKTYMYQVRIYETSGKVIKSELKEIKIMK